MNCSECGNKIPDNVVACKYCGHKFTANPLNNTLSIEHQTRDRLLARSEYNIEGTRLSWSTAAAGAGAITILISLAFPWYVLKFLLTSTNIGFTDIISFDTLAIISSLLIITAVISALLVLISAVYSLYKRKDNKTLWAGLGLLAIGCIIFSSLNEIIQVNNYDFQNEIGGKLINGISLSVGPGVIVASIGAVLMTVSAFGRRSRKRII